MGGGQEDEYRRRGMQEGKSNTKDVPKSHEELYYFLLSRIIYNTYKCI